MNEPKTADPLAEAVVAQVRSGMIVGLGTGRTASRGILALAQRVHDEGLDVQCVPTSHATETLARSQRLTLADFAMIERVDILFDGADEVDGHLRMLKGAGGAITRERIVAHASDKRVYMVSEAKLVERLGSKSTLPICVIAFGLASIREHLRSLGFSGVVRRTSDGQLFLTDNGNLVIDVTIEDQNVEELARLLDSVPGVVDHGLFLTECDELYIERGTGGRGGGSIEKIVRTEMK
ncbi:MAG: ribose 5-phosphate isomerase A [Phycisphaerales bacterium]